MFMAFKYLRDYCAEKGRDSFIAAGQWKRWVEMHVGRRLLPMSLGWGFPGGLAVKIYLPEQEVWL